ncbi:MAG: chemotaxis protein CheW [Prochloraceae cyanobacterium]
MSSLKANSATETTKAIVFDIAGHLLALPVSAVFKVIRSSMAICSDLGNRKLVHLEEQALPILDLHQFLARVQPHRQDDYQNQFLSTQEQFLVLTHFRKGNLSAIPVDEPPSLIELPLSSIYTLPKSYKEKISNLANHVAVCPYENSTINIMLLDLQQAVASIGLNLSESEIYPVNLTNF